MEHISVEERLAALERKVMRLEDRQRIENLYSKHNYYFSAGQGRRIVPELWTKDDDASIEYGASGVYQKLWKVVTFYVNFDIAGRMATFSCANKWLSIAKDGLTARGVWMVIGTESDAGDLAKDKPKEDDERRVLLSSVTEKGEAYRAEVLLQKHEVEFRKEDGVWKIFRLHISEFFRCPAGRDWVSYAKERQITDGMWLEYMFETPDPYPSWENLPSGPTTRHWQYDVDALPQLDTELEDTDE
ncbi:MAG TPA: nuclear transport factor 2 family protein [Eubacteriales bacterium]|nr:nuclear transport factor 2 family protein [Clostridia bacterium]HRV73887.1 nuclear transport factor 2 family protein [Eubacteriales bacterium]